MFRDRYVIKKTEDNQWMILLVAGNGEDRMWTESYTRREDAVRAWRSIRWAALKAALKGLVTVQ